MAHSHKPEKSLKDLTKLVDSDQPLETFVDSLDQSSFQAGILRLNFSVTRFGDPNPPKPMRGKRIPSARLVMTPPCAVELFNSLNQMMSVFEQQGLVQRDGGEARVLN